MNTEPNADDIARVKDCLQYLADHPHERIPSYWRDGVLEEAEQLGIIPPRKGGIGCNWKPMNIPGPLGGDFEDVF